MSRTRRLLARLLLTAAIVLLLAACTSADDPAWAAPDPTATPAVQATVAAPATPTISTMPPTATPQPSPSATLAPTAGPPPRVVSAYPVHGDRSIGAERPLVLVFDRAMDRASVEQAFTVDPESAVTFAWTSDTQVTIQPESSWQPETPYEALLATGAAAADGAALAEAFTLRFASGGRGAPVPVLMYHHFAELSADATQGQRDWTVSPQALQEQLAYLAENGWHTISPTQLADYIEAGTPLPLRALMITIDDGYQEVLDVALPLFLETELRPVLFIVTDYVDYAAYLGWDELAGLAVQGFVIGSHSMDHSDMRQASDAEREQQIAGSKALLEEQLGVTVDAFCYPYGSLNQATKQAVANSGYRTAYSLNPTIYQSPDDPYFVGRMRVDYSTTLEQFVAMLPD